MMTAIAAIFTFMIVIIVHEGGHFLMAKFVGIRVNEFSIGMGPKIIDTKKGETQYTLRLLPIGGYVSMEGEEEESQDSRGFNNASALGRIAVVAAGAIMNFILAIIVLAIVTYSLGEPNTMIENVIEESPAMESGLENGDIITNINSNNIKTWQDITDNITKYKPGEEIDIIVDRDGIEKEFILKTIDSDGQTMIGIEPGRDKSLGIAIKGGFTKTGIVLGSMFDFIKMVFTGNISSGDVSGPVGVISAIGAASKAGIIDLLLLVGIISVNLGFFNLLPIPALDGSKILFILIEVLRGKPMKEETEGKITMIGFALLMGLIIYVTIGDIKSLFIK